LTITARYRNVSRPLMPDCARVALRTIISLGKSSRLLPA
jgi:hypothetical protein